MKFSKETRDIIIKRAVGRCELCGLPAPVGQIHHRRPRGMGGSKDPLAGTAANGILLHLLCHTRIEMNRSESLANGWLIQQGHDPEFVPIKRFGQFVHLLPNGSISPISDASEIN